MGLPPDLKDNIALTPVTTSLVDGHAMSRTGIDNLPVKLLVEIFGYTSGVYGSFVDDQSTSSYVSKLHNMAQVCRRWLEIIKDAAKLWAFVMDRTPTYASLVLKQSQSHAFSLSITSCPLDMSLYTAVLSHSHRWIQADIRLTHPNQEASHMLEAVSAPMLWHLKLHTPTLLVQPVKTLSVSSAPAPPSNTLT
ncbi:hypothetical protein FRB94_003253 [Tulasnella sp. JGI-2019a]|nr:hypothetical protein FRB94_003253 [Tulasnella sp. JGI-2019a]